MTKLLLLLALPASAITGGEDIAKIHARFDRYGELMAGTGPVPTSAKYEATRILDELEKQFRTPTFMVKAHFNHDPKNADERDVENQVRFMKLLAESMVSSLRDALSFKSKYSALQKEQIKGIYMGDRETMFKLFFAMREALKTRGIASSPMPKPLAGAGKPPPKAKGKVDGAVTEGAIPLLR